MRKMGINTQYFNMKNLQRKKEKKKKPRLRRDITTSLKYKQRTIMHCLL